MAILEILTYPDERLKKVSEPVTDFNDELLQFIQDLKHAMRGSPGSVGIAAPQVGRLQRITIVDVSGKPKIKSHGKLILINPEILSWDGMAMGREGCMSVPEYTGSVMRAERIELAALNEKNEKRVYEIEGYEARAVQHEVDHLDGVLFLDRLVSRRSDLYRRKTSVK